MPETQESKLEVRRTGGRVLSQEAEDLFVRGQALLAEGNLEDALKVLCEAADRAPEHARIRSLLGLAVARGEKDFERARALCESAAKQEFFNPDLYLNLAKVFLIFGRRAEAMRYLRRGQMIDPANEELRAVMQSLGSRRLPVFPFLPRKHPLNRRLGVVRKLIESGVKGRLAA